MTLLAKAEEATDKSFERVGIRFIPTHPNPPDNVTSSALDATGNHARPDPPDRGTTPTDEGTGSRGDCLYKQELPPLTRLAGGKNLKLTVKEHPTVWVYVPYTPEEAPSGEFVLQDGENEVYRTRFQLLATPGVVSISLPPTTKPLEVGKEYRWYFEINCPHPESSSEQPASVTGVVQRVPLSSELDSELKAAKTPLERIGSYAKHQIWYDALSELALLRLEETQNPTLKSVWVELLSDKNFDLQRVAQEPIAGSVMLFEPTTEAQSSQREE